MVANKAQEADDESPTWMMDFVRKHEIISEVDNDNFGFKKLNAKGILAVPTGNAEEKKPQCDTCKEWCCIFIKVTFQRHYNSITI